jgi:hypothetical protein
MGARGLRARYRLSAEHHALVDGKASASQRVAGLWTTTARAGGRTEVEFTATRLEVVGEAAPTAAEVATPFVVATTDGLLTGLGFAEETPDGARNLLTSLATTLQVTDRPGAAWTALEEDLTGRYEARYTRAGERITRTRGRYTQMRGAHGLDASPVDMLASDEHTEVVLDARGLVSATVKLSQTVSPGRGMATVTILVTASLERVDVSEVALVAGADLAPAPVTARLDRAPLQRRRLESLVAGASTSTLLAEAHRAAHLDEHAPDRTRAGASALRRLSALAQLDERAPVEMADAIRRDPGDHQVVGLVAGALSSSDSPAATGALASLLDEALPDDARSQILAQLGLARAPTAESAAALTRALDGPLGHQAALSLGAEASKLGDDTAGGDAIDLLLARYAAAAPGDKRVYLQALANTGSPRVLPALKDAIQGADYDLARAAAYGLRSIPGDDVDDYLATLIENGTSVAVEAIMATGYRSATLWAPRLAAFQKQFQGQKRVLDAIQAVLGRWAQLPDAKSGGLAPPK